MKTKDRCGKHSNEAGMLLNTKEIHADAGMLLKSKGVTSQDKEEAGGH
jgi:hypothetical protein